jgi:molecular chaperone GrpE
MAQRSSKKELELEQQIGELTADLQRVQADFVNYRARMDDERRRNVENAQASTVMKLLPVVDNIERAIMHVPQDLADNPWAKGVAALSKGLDKSLLEIGVSRIQAVGEPFSPLLHEAISAEGEGDEEIVSEELRAGYLLGSQVMRPAMVKVTRRQSAPTQAADDLLKDQAQEEPSERIHGTED